MEKVSLKSILHALSLIIPEHTWDDYKFTEWATAAARSIKIYDAFEKKHSVVTVTEHKFTLPDDVVHLELLLAYSSDDTNWKAMLPAASSITDALDCVDNLFAEGESCCPIVYSINSTSGITNLKDGKILVTYLTYPKDSEGYMLVPNDELYKTAVINYCLTQYWQTKAMSSQEGAFQMYEHYRALWELYKSKAIAQLNTPDLGQLENIRKLQSKNFPPDHFKSLFGSINN